MFHSQNHAVVHKESATGQEIVAENTANAPLELKVYGASEQKQSTQGKNLLDPAWGNFTSQTVNGVTVTRQNDLFVLDGTCEKDIALFIFGGMTYLEYPYILQAGKTYQPSKTVVSGVIETGRCEVIVSTSNLDGSNRASRSGKIGPYDVNRRINFLRFDVYAGAVFNNYTLAIQLEEGEEATAYEPFVPNSPSPDYPSEIVSAVDFEVGSVGRNLFDREKYAKISSFALTDEGTPIQLHPNTTYTIQITYRTDGKTGLTGRGYLLINETSAINDGDDWLSVAHNSQAYSEMTRRCFGVYTTGEDGCLYIAYYGRADITTQEHLDEIWSVSNVILAEGSYTRDTMPGYEPYRGGVAAVGFPLHGIPDGSGGWAARDYIEVKDGSVKLVRECGEIAFDGTERWFALAVYLPGSDGVYYTNDLTDALYAPNVWCICTHFAGRKSGSAASYGAGSAWLQSTSAYPRIFLGTEIDDINDFKVWLAARHAAGTPVKVVYALETPQITDITATDLGGALLSMKSVQYYTRIYHTSALPVEMEVTILKLGR